MQTKRLGTRGKELYEEVGLVGVQKLDGLARRLFRRDGSRMRILKSNGQVSCRGECLHAREEPVERGLDGAAAHPQQGDVLLGVHEGVGLHVVEALDDRACLGVQHATRLRHAHEVS